MSSSTRSADAAAAASAAADAADAAATTTTTTARPPVRRAAAIADLQRQRQLHPGSASSQDLLSASSSSIPASTSGGAASAAATAAAATTSVSKSRKRAASDETEESSAKRAKYSGSTQPLSGSQSASGPDEVGPTPRLIGLPSEKVAPLSREIVMHYNALVRELHCHSDRETKRVPFLGKEVSVGDIVAYQIGMGKLFLAWCGAGRDKRPQMPGDGFTSWDDKDGLANHLCAKWKIDEGAIQEAVFQSVTAQIIGVVQKEQKHLNTPGRWAWCNAPHPEKRLTDLGTMSFWVKMCSTDLSKEAMTLLQQHRG
ncbi:MAG: hypothetical protein S4CHLAM2_00580 [Chlamydiales bacterium]|nr:hypothetical protein [Chlamydiales bacterium]